MNSTENNDQETMKSYCFVKPVFVFLGEYMVDSRFSCWKMYYYMVSNQRTFVFHDDNFENCTCLCSLSCFLRWCYLSASNFLLTHVREYFNPYIYVCLAERQSEVIASIWSMEKTLLDIQYCSLSFDYTFDDSIDC